ncbi:DUF2511 domain-containing protein [Actinokineospora diospyrosa]|uniref:DUF2511 domain-containing protein n=1 Tax=Actinokineospora diospyrosa TaxID=103728 RepID=A0ABT1IFZ1_9PSEU|nr:DUF2511 domain-containing protein [Actinokineospora diospyrosa]MCP2271557.1 Protein of unknown function (DUF2511) [Actinokineospora diospyrosa]
MTLSRTGSTVSKSAVPKAAVPKVAVAAAVALLALGGCAAGRSDPQTTSTVPLPAPEGSTQRVSEANFGYLWPLTVNEGTVECRNETEVVFITPDGTTYALNEKAESAGAQKIDPLRAEGSQGQEISLGALLSTGIKLCTKP